MAASASCRLRYCFAFASGRRSGRGACAISCGGRDAYASYVSCDASSFSGASCALIGGAKRTLVAALGSMGARSASDLAWGHVELISAEWQLET